MKTDKEIIIKPTRGLLDLKLDEFFQYKNLILMFVKRNYSTRYKQMILGPAWLIISPILSVVAYTIVFGKIANLSTDGIPQPLFYLAGNILWSFFANSINTNSNTFISNASIFGKIYFPRMVIPVANTITLFLDFLIQFVLLGIVYGVYVATGTTPVMVNKTILLLPIYLIQVALLGMGIGIIISSLTTKYRDLMVLVGFGIQIWLYISPVIYSTSIVPDQFKSVYLLNPIAPLLLNFKYSLFGTDGFYILSWIISIIVTLLISVIGIIVFNQIEKDFMDTI